MYGHGKASVFRKITACHTTQLLTEVLLDTSARADAVVKAGLQLMVLLYGGKPGESLNKMRFESYSRMGAVSAHRPQLERLPPTENAALYHVMRVHL